MFIGEIPQIAAQTGIGLGSVIAVACSWQRNKSILWAILHGFLSWIYVSISPSLDERTKRNGGNDEAAPIDLCYSTHFFGQLQGEHLSRPAINGRHLPNSEKHAIPPRCLFQ
jgi:hypothetical protein